MSGRAGQSKVCLATVCTPLGGSERETCVSGFAMSERKLEIVVTRAVLSAHNGPSACALHASCAHNGPSACALHASCAHNGPSACALHPPPCAQRTFGLCAASTRAQRTFGHQRYPPAHNGPSACALHASCAHNGPSACALHPPSGHDRTGQPAEPGRAAMARIFEANRTRLRRDGLSPASGLENQVQAPKFRVVDCLVSRGSGAWNFEASPRFSDATRLATS